MTSVKRVTDIVSEIAAASREQATGMEQVNKAISQMDQVTQGNASPDRRELSGTAANLTGQAQQLQALVVRFKLGDTRSREHPRPPPPIGRPRCRRRRPSPASRPAPIARHVPGLGSTRESVAPELELVGAGVGGDDRGGFEEF